MAGLFGKVNRNKWNHWSVYYLPVWHVIIGYATCLCQGIIPFQDTLSLALWHNLNPIIPHASSSDYKAANDLCFAVDEFKQQRNRQLIEDFENGKSNEDIRPAPFGRSFTSLWSYIFPQNVQTTWDVEDEVQFWHDQEKRYCSKVCR